MNRFFRGLALAAFLITLSCSGSQGNKSAWKAVFLTSGQVYYGKLSRNQGQFYKLQDVYYIRVNPNDDKTKAPDLTLVKLGNEIHGPEDAIYLNRDHILYIEDLKADGQVVKAIAEAKAAGTSPAVAGQPPAPAAPGSPVATTAPNVPSIPADQAEQFKQFQKFLESQKAERVQPR